jgi:putative transposase
MYGYRRIRAKLGHQGIIVNGKKVLRIMRQQKICAIFPGPKTTVVDPKAYKYPYLLNNGLTLYPHRVWQVDITYLKTPYGFIYLTALIDVYSRYVVGHCLSSTLDTESCVLALERAILSHGIPTIINSDQGSQFTSDLWINALIKYGILISMCGKGRSNDNAFIERLWRTLKYEWLYIYGARKICDYKKLLTSFIKWYNDERPHQALKYKTPAQMLKTFAATKICDPVENSLSFHTVLADTTTAAAITCF